MKHRVFFLLSISLFVVSTDTYTTIDGRALSESPPYTRTPSPCGTLSGGSNGSGGHFDSEIDEDENVDLGGHFYEGGARPPSTRTPSPCGTLSGGSNGSDTDVFDLEGNVYEGGRRPAFYPQPGEGCLQWLMRTVYEGIRDISSYAGKTKEQ